MNRKSVMQLIFSVASSFAATVNAQNTEADATLEEVTVTAQKTAQDIQRVPLAVTALTGNALQETGTTDVVGLAARVPNFNFGQQYGGAEITIRGIGLSTLAVGAEAPIAFHQDGVFVQRTAGAMLSLFDLDRVEVLRGPQGTLYGRNATGGTVNVISRDPSSDFDGYLRLSGGTYGLFASEGAVGGQLAEGINGRVAFRTSDHGGFGTNTTTGHEIDTQHERAVRAKVEFLPVEGLRILLEGDYAHAGDNLGVAWHYLGPGGQQAQPTGVLLGGEVSTDIRDVANEYDPIRQIEAWGTGLNVSYDLGFGTLKSLTAYRSTESRSRQDLDSTSFQLFSPMDAREKGRQLSEELQLTGHGLDTDWLVGLFEYHEFDNGAVSSPVFNGTFVTQGYYAGSRIQTDAQAVFGQVTHHFSDQWSATVGARYSTERKGVVDQQSLDLATPVTDPITAAFNPTAFPEAIECSEAVQTLPAVCVPHRRWNSFTPKFGIEYQATTTSLVYLSATKGFRSGTYSLGAVQAPVNPETVWSYEAGLKSRFLGDTLQTNLVAFWYNYNNLQVTKAEGTQTIEENAADARVKGIEAEIVSRPIAPVRLDFSGAYLDAKFLRYISADPARPQGDGVTFDNGAPAFNLAGNRLPQAPEVSFLAGGEYSLEESLGRFTLRAEVSYASRIFFSAFDRDEVSTGSHTRVNAFLNFVTPDDRWSVSLAGRNLSNVIAPTNAYVTTSLVGYIVNANIEQPRTFIATVGYKF